jgi:hypothetical protein
LFQDYDYLKKIELNFPLAEQKLTFEQQRQKFSLNSNLLDINVNLYRNVTSKLPFNDNFVLKIEKSDFTYLNFVFNLKIEEIMRNMDIFEIKFHSNICLMNSDNYKLKGSYYISDPSLILNGESNLFLWFKANLELSNQLNLDEPIFKVNYKHNHKQNDERLVEYDALLEVAIPSEQIDYKLKGHLSTDLFEYRVIRNTFDKFLAELRFITNNDEEDKAKLLFFKIDKSFETDGSSRKENSISFGFRKFELDLYDWENQFALDMQNLDIEVLNDFVISLDEKYFRQIVFNTSVRFLVEANDKKYIEASNILNFDDEYHSTKSFIKCSNHLEYSDNIKTDIKYEEYERTTFLRINDDHQFNRRSKFQLNNKFEYKYDENFALESSFLKKNYFSKKINFDFQTTISKFEQCQADFQFYWDNTKDDMLELKLKSDKSFKNVEGSLFKENGVKFAEIFLADLSESTKFGVRNLDYQLHDRYPIENLLTLVNNDNDRFTLKSIHIEIIKNEQIIMLKKNEQIASRLKIETNKVIEYLKTTSNFGLYLQVLDRNANLTGRFIDFKSDLDDLLNYELLVRGDSCSGYKFLANAKLTGNIEESTVKSTLSYSSRDFILPRPHTFVFKHLLTNDVISSDLDIDLPTTDVNHKLKFYLHSEDEFKSLKLAEIEIKQPNKDLAEKLFYEKLEREIKFGLVNFDLDISNLYVLQDLYNLDKQNLNEFVVSLKEDSKSYENEKFSISSINNLGLIAVKNEQSKFFEFNLEMGHFENDYSLISNQINPNYEKVLNMKTDLKYMNDAFLVLGHRFKEKFGSNNEMEIIEITTEIETSSNDKITLKTAGKVEKNSYCSFRALNNEIDIRECHLTGSPISVDADFSLISPLNNIDRSFKLQLNRNNPKILIHLEQNKIITDLLIKLDVTKTKTDDITFSFKVDTQVFSRPLLLNTTLIRKYDEANLQKIIFHLELPGRNDGYDDDDYTVSLITDRYLEYIKLDSNQPEPFSIVYTRNSTDSNNIVNKILASDSNSLFVQFTLNSHLNSRSQLYLHLNAKQNIEKWFYAGYELRNRYQMTDCDFNFDFNINRFDSSRSLNTEFLAKCNNKLIGYNQVYFERFAKNNERKLKLVSKQFDNEQSLNAFVSEYFDHKIYNYTIIQKFDQFNRFDSKELKIIRQQNSLTSHFKSFSNLYSSSLETILCNLSILKNEMRLSNSFDCSLNIPRLYSKQINFGYDLKNNKNKNNFKLDLVVLERILRLETLLTSSSSLLTSSTRFYFDQKSAPNVFIQVDLNKKPDSMLVQVYNLPNIDVIQLNSIKKRVNSNEVLFKNSITYKLMNNKNENNFDLNYKITNNFRTLQISIEANLQRPRLNWLNIYNFNNFNGRLNNFYSRINNLIELNVNREEKKMSMDFIKTNTNDNDLSILKKFDQDNNCFDVRLKTVDQSYRLNIGMFNESRLDGYLMNENEMKILAIATLEVLDSVETNKNKALYLKMKWNNFWNEIESLLTGQLQTRPFIDELYSELNKDLGQASNSIQKNIRAVSNDYNKLIDILTNKYDDDDDDDEDEDDDEDDDDDNEDDDDDASFSIFDTYNSVSNYLNEINIKATKENSDQMSQEMTFLPIIKYNSENSSLFQNNLIIYKPLAIETNLYQVYAIMFKNFKA